jgi:demethylmenaquinone methyltransferase/2-methoxy-6-polyprenyl-1,4-benzoquinol methylase
MSTPPDGTLWDRERLESPHTQPDKSSRVRKMFDAIAPTYERVNTVASAGRDAGWRREMVRLTGVEPDDVLVDIACGTGDVARAFARPAGDQARPRRIIGVDFSAGMICHAADRAPPGSLFCLADALHLPIGDDQASIATCAFGIRNLQDLDAGLREMYRILRPGGRAVILEFGVPRGRFFGSLYLFYATRVLPVLGTLISRDRTGAYRYLPRSVVSFPGREEVMQALRSAGFADVKAYPLSWGIVSIYLAVKASVANRTDVHHHDEGLRPGR